jgi:hypothetical protein
MTKEDRTMRSTVLCLGLICTLSLLPSSSAAFDLDFEIVSEGMMDSHQGFYVEARDPGGPLFLSQFFFEENGYVRIFASKMPSEDTYFVYPEGTYWITTESLHIGQSWNSTYCCPRTPTIATVINTATMTIPAGTFFCYEVEQRQADPPYEVEDYFWFSADCGLVMLGDPGDWTELQSYSLFGGSGFFPMAIGNQWNYSSRLVDAGEVETPARFTLYQSSPNPLRELATIRFDLPGEAEVQLRVFDTRGRLVRSGLDGVVMPAGRHQWEWDRRHDAGARVGAGIYFYLFRADRYAETRKAVVVD